MKRAIFALLVSIFFGSVFAYVLNNVSPWKADAIQNAITRYDLKTEAGFDVFLLQALNLGLIWGLLNLRNLAIFLFCLGGFVIFAFASVHMFIEKLFVSKFYEQPDWKVAVRRGSITYLTLVGLILLNFFGGLLWYNALAVIILGLALELLFFNLTRRKPESIIKKQNAEKNSK